MSSESIKTPMDDSFTAALEIIAGLRKALDFDRERRTGMAQHLLATGYQGDDLLDGVRWLRERHDRLQHALQQLVLDANRLCDRQLGGTYEADCRRSLRLAREALFGVDPEMAPVNSDGSQTGPQ